LAAQQAANNQVHNCHKAKKRGLRKHKLQKKIVFYLLIKSNQVNKLY